MDADSIIRVERDEDNPYFMMVRSSAQDSRLSFAARGVLAYLLSKPNNWKLQPANIQTEGDIGREACTTLLKELEDNGYIWVERRMKRADGKFFPNSYTVFEKPYTGQPYTVEPLRVNRERSTSTIHNTEGQSKDKTSTRSARKDLLRQVQTFEPVVNESKSEMTLKAAQESTLSGYIAMVFGKRYTIDKATAASMCSKTTVKTGSVDVVYPSVVEMFDQVPAFKKFVEVRCRSLMAVQNMTPLNALKNICKIGFDPGVIPGNEKKMPGYHIWIKSNQSVVEVQEMEAIDLGVPPDESDLD